MWNEELASLAQDRASRCGAEPPAQNSSSRRHVGWNTKVSAPGVDSFADVIAAWFEEGEDFLYLSGRCREGAVCQHYTQVGAAGAGGGSGGVSASR